MYKILLVEDDPMISEIYQRKLTNAGYEVDIAISGEEVLLKVHEKKYDLVLLDLVLPEMDGIEVLMRLHQEGLSGKELRVVVFSNLNDFENQEKAMRFGASGFIPKSQYNPSQLASEVNRLMLQFYEQEKNVRRRTITEDPLSSDRRTIPVSENGQRVESKEGKVPVTGQPSQAGERRKRIVFIEDEAIFLELFVDKLRNDGYEIVVARTGLKGLEEIYAKQTDLVITDIMMPQLKGDEVVRRLKSNQSTSKIPIIVLSVSVTDQEIQAIRQYGVTDVIVKTEITPSDLARRVRELLKD